MSTAQAPPKWQGKARGGRLGNLFFAVLVRSGLFWLTPFFLFWVSLYFLGAAPRARRASFELCRKLGRGGMLGGRLWFAFRHFYTFGTLMLDRIAVLSGQAHKYRIEFHGEEHIRTALKQGCGVVLLTGHLGNWEAMGHLLTRLEARVCMVMYDGLTDLRLRQTLERLAEGRSFRILYTDGSPSSAAGILSALKGGEIVGMMGDRIFAGESVRVPFLGSEASFPTGPLVIAAASRAPLIHVFAIRRGWRRYSFHGFTPEILRYTDRKNKRADLERWAQTFARRLEDFLRQHPHQWGNFYSFWDSGSNSS